MTSLEPAIPQGHVQNNSTKIDVLPVSGTAQVNPDVTPCFFTYDDVRKHNGLDSCWIIIWDNVYDVTRFLDEHPGSSEIIYENAGCDVTAQFEEKGHSEWAYSHLDQYCIGRVISRKGGAK